MAEQKNRTQAFEMQCNRRILNIPYKDHVTNEKGKKRQTDEEAGRQY